MIERIVGGGREEEDGLMTGGIGRLSSERYTFKWSTVHGGY